MLSALFDTRSVSSLPWDTDDHSAWGSWGPDSAGPTWSGSRVTKDTATQLLAVYGSASFITDEISTLPITIDGAPRPLWVDIPSDGLTRIPWVSQIVWSLLLSGNAYLAVIRSGGQTISVDVINPDKVTVRRESGRKAYFINGQRSAMQIVHIPGRMRPGDLYGMSPVEWCRQTIGLGIAATKYGAEFFDGEGNMPGVIEVPGSLQPETQLQMGQWWKRKRKSGGRGLPGILQGGAQWKQTGVNHEQAQFLATRKWNAAEIAGQIFMLDPSDLGIPVDGTSLTYANLEQRNVRRMQVALMPWIRKIEEGLSPLIDGGSYKFDVDSRLRGNTRESYETLSVAVRNGFMSIDEARDILGFLPLTDAELLAYLATHGKQSSGGVPDGT